MDEEPAIAIRQTDPALHVALQHDQLAAEHHILYFKPAPGVCTENLDSNVLVMKSAEDRV
jgi:hypothetical protein